MKERHHDKKLIQKYQHTEVTLDDEQNDEMEQIVDIINQDGSDVLREIFEQSREKIGRNDVEDVWKSDMRSKFKNDQATNGNLHSMYNVVQ